jgi:DegV family protein with EDD domain
MRIGIVVDSACDLPQSFLRRNNIVVLPISVRIGDAVRTDFRDEDITLKFLESHVADHGAAAETTPPTTAEIRKLFLEQLVIDYDQVFCLTITKNRSPLHANVVQASYEMLQEYKPIRQAAGHPSPFALRVLDTQNLFAAQAVLAMEAVRLRDEDTGLQPMREQLEALSNQLHGYMVPRDLHYLRARARHKGDRSVGLLSAALGTALDIKPILHGHRGETAPVGKIKGFNNAVETLFGFIAKRVIRGLKTPVVCLSYGGPLDEMRTLPGYRELRDVCDQHGVNLAESVMSLTGMVNVGKGALTAGFADDPHSFAP